MKTDKTRIAELETTVGVLNARIEQLELNAITCLSALRALCEDKAPNDLVGIPVALA